MITNRLYIRARCFASGSFLGMVYARNKRVKSLGSRVEAEKAIDKWLGRDLCIEERRALISDMIEMATKWHFEYDEYFYYHFKERSLEDRLAFVPDITHNVFARRINKARNLFLFSDKGSCAKRFAPYYKRDFCVIYKSFGNMKSALLKGRGSYNAFHRFIQEHKVFIAKPLTSGCGNGVRIFDQSLFANVESLIDSLVKEYCHGIRGGFIVEEIIRQDPRMAIFHPSSVNTIRITTVRFRDHVEIIHPFMRIGRGGNIVDNGGAGGLLSDIDPDSGRVFVCMDERANNYEKHPETGVDIIGFEIPKWHDVVALAKELALVVKGQCYTGWDLALTDKGWIMVEGNALSQFVGWQIPTQNGFMKEANEILKELGKRPLRY